MGIGSEPLIVDGMSIANAPKSRVAITLFDGFTALDAVGPYQMLAFTPGIVVDFVAEQPGLVQDDCRTLSLPAVGLEDIPQPDVVIVPGGPGTAQALASGLPQWVAETHRGTQWTTSVCSGSLLLAVTGLLKGRPATTHFLHFETLAKLGAVPTRQRVVEVSASRIITAAGVSSGIDMALGLVEKLTDRPTAEAVQLWTEYDPQPPFDSGAPDRVTSEVLALAQQFDRTALAARSA